MGTPPRATERTVYAIGDATHRIRLRLLADGELCEHDDEALLLLDFAAAWAETADLGRRRRQHIEDTGEDSPWLARLEREHRRDVEQRIAA